MDFFTYFKILVLQQYCNQIMVDNSKLKSYPNHALCGKILTLVHGNPRHSQTLESVERARQDIQNVLTTWMKDNDTNKCSDNLPFIQFGKNTTYQERNNVKSL